MLKDANKEVLAAINTASKTNYLNPNYHYIKNAEITEWDIKSAGLSVLKYCKLLPEKELDELSKMEKHARTVKEGLLQKEYPIIAEKIIETLSKARQAFVYLNNIEDYQILTIKKDAIFLINKIPTNNIIKDYFEFRKKNTYSSVFIAGKKEIYYDAENDILDTKGIPEESVKLQEEYILNDIKRILKSAEGISQEALYKSLKSYRSKYLNRELPLEVYRELDSGKFRIRNYLIDNITDDLKSELDISQNYMNYILPLIQELL